MLEGDSNAETESQRIINRTVPFARISALSRQTSTFQTPLRILARFFEPLLFVSFDTMARIKLHEQAKRRIERLIRDRARKPGSQLPTETNLASELYVSRTTIRNALKFLEQEGKIERTPGRGTIVRQPRME